MNDFGKILDSFEKEFGIQFENWPSIFEQYLESKDSVDEFRLWLATHYDGYYPGRGTKAAEIAIRPELTKEEEKARLERVNRCNDEECKSDHWNK